MSFMNVLQELLQICKDCRLRQVILTILGVTRSLAECILLFGILSGVIPASPAPVSHVETITGRIVAYSNVMMCLNGNAYWSILIHVKSGQKETTTDFITVDFTTPCGDLPDWLKGKSSYRKFRLIRNQELDATLTEFMDCKNTSGSCPHVGIWKRVPETDDYSLPFGKRIPAYRSKDLPLVPVL